MHQSCKCARVKQSQLTLNRKISTLSKSFKKFNSKFDREINKLYSISKTILQRIDLNPKNEVKHSNQDKKREYKDKEKDKDQLSNFD